MKWNYAYDSMPEKGIECLVVTHWNDGTRHIEIDTLNEYGDWEFNSYERTGCVVTYWMPLPELPNED